MTNESETDYSGDSGQTSRPDTIVIINCVLHAPLMLISIIGNALVLAAILRTSSLRSPSSVFLCSLATSDFLVGLIVQPIYIANELTNDFLYTIRNITTVAASGVSLLTVTAISVDRFLALHYHMRYPNLMTTHRAVYTSAALWLKNFLFALISSWTTRAYYLAIVFTIISCLVISTVCYIRIFRIVRHHHLQIHAQQQAVQGLNAENNQNAQRSNTSAMNTFIYYIVMILCYTPLFTSLSIASISRANWKNAWIVAETIAFMNSSINPVLYCWRLRELRTAVVKTAKQILCKQTDEN